MQWQQQQLYEFLHCVLATMSCQRCTLTQDTDRCKAKSGNVSSSSCQQPLIKQQTPDTASGADNVSVFAILGQFAL
jgi:hypothetical protein